MLPTSRCWILATDARPTDEAICAVDVVTDVDVALTNDASNTSEVDLVLFLELAIRLDEQIIDDVI
jgi:hypothetical protein